MERWSRGRDEETPAFKNGSNTPKGEGYIGRGAEPPKMQYMHLEVYSEDESA